MYVSIVKMPGHHTFYDGSKIFEPIASVIGMGADQLNLVYGQLVSLTAAFIFYRYMNVNQVSKTLRIVYPFIVGIYICYFCYGSAIKHPIFLTLGNYLILKYSPGPYVHKASFIFSMGYLFYIHFYRFYVLTSYSIDVTGTMMVLVQKCTTLGFSLHDGKCKKKEELNDIQKKEAIVEVPSIINYLSYMFSYQTVMVGPLCFYTDYKKYIDGDHLKVEGSKQPCPKKAAIKKLIASVCFMVIIILFGKYSPEIIGTPEYLQLSWIKWSLWWFFVILIQRVQYYYVWVFADAVSNVSGFGFNGYDENGEEKWNLVSNVYPLKLEMAQTFKETLDSWNVATMFWLRRVAYDRVPKNMRTLTTYMLSAVWHGFFTGYYLTFATGALFTLAGRYARRSLRWRFLKNPNLKLMYDIVTFLSTKIALAYATLPFVTMHLNPGWFCYKRVYFFVHIIALFLVLVVPIILPPEKKENIKNEGKKDKIN